MKKIIIISLLAILSSNAFSQWSGSGCEYESNGKVGINMSSCPSYHFVVNNSGTNQGIQALFGGTSFQGYPFASYNGSTSVIELQSENHAMFSIGANKSGSDYDAAWYGINSSCSFLFFSNSSTTTATKPFEIQMDDNGASVVRAMTIWPSGQVGVGTAATTLGTDTKFAVEGLIACRELKVLHSATSWPDYVFNKDFKRTSLYDIEKYINENKHLPQLSSAKEIEENGNVIGETQAQILQALEELYLHVIELKKENDELKHQVANFKK